MNRSLTFPICTAVTTLAAGLIVQSFLLCNVSAQSNGVYIYPSKGQSQDQQDKDRYECHRWAVQQTGFDPSSVNPTNPVYADPQPYQPSQRHVLKGAAKGTAMGVVGGAIVGNAGKGAAAGAAMGGMSGGFRRADERKQQQSDQQQRAQSNAQSNASQVAGYQRAMAACLQSRGYSVK